MQPAGEFRLWHGVIGEAFHHTDHVAIRGMEIHTIELEKNEGRLERCAFVAINKGIYFRDAEGIARCKIEEIGFTISPKVERARHTHLQQSCVAHRGSAAVLGDHPVVDRLDSGQLHPARPSPC